MCRKGTPRKGQAIMALTGRPALKQRLESDTSLQGIADVLSPSGDAAED